MMKATFACFVTLVILASMAGATLPTKSEKPYSGGRVGCNVVNGIIHCFSCSIQNGVQHCYEYGNQGGSGGNSGSGSSGGNNNRQGGSGGNSMHHGGGSHQGGGHQRGSGGNSAHQGGGSHHQGGSGNGIRTEHFKWGYGPSENGYSSYCFRDSGNDDFHFPGESKVMDGERFVYAGFYGPMESYVQCLTGPCGQEKRMCPSQCSRDGDGRAGGCWVGCSSCTWRCG